MLRTGIATVAICLSALSPSSFKLHRAMLFAWAKSPHRGKVPAGRKRVLPLLSSSRACEAIRLFICHPERSEGSIFGFPIPQHPPQPHPNGTACVGMSPSTRHKLHPHRQAITRCARVEVSLKPEQLQVASSNALHKGAVRTSRHALRGQSATVRNPLPAQNAVKHRKLRSAPYALFHLNQKPSPPTPPSQTLKNCRF